MGVVIRQGVATTIISYLGIAIGAITTLWVLPRFLQVDEIGLIRLILETSMLVSAYSLLGSTDALIKFFPYFKEKQERIRQLNFLVLTIAGIGLVIFTIALGFFSAPIKSIFAEKSPSFNEFFYFLIPFTLCFFLKEWVFSYSRINLMIVIPKIFHEIYVRVSIIVIIFCYFYFDLNLQQLLLLYLMVYLSATLFNLIYVQLKHPIHISFSLSHINRGEIKQLLTFMGFLILGALSSDLLTRIDLWMISSLLGLDQTGIYTTALFIGAVIDIPRRSLNQIILPLISDFWKKNDLEGIHSIYKKSALTQLIIGGVIFLLIWINIDDMFLLIPKTTVFSQGKWVVFFIGLTKLIEMATGVNNEILYTSKYYKYNLIFIGSLFGLGIYTNWILIPVYGITGAAIATFISFVLFNLIKFIFIWIKLKMQPFSWNTLFILIIYLICWFLSTILPSTNLPFLNITYKSLLVGTLPLGVIYYFKLSEDINNLIDGVLKRIKW